MKKLLSFLSLLLLFSPLTIHAAPKKPQKESDTSSLFTLIAAGGYGASEGAYSQDGQTGQARLALGLKLVTVKTFLFGLETGVQSGNSFRLSASDSLIAASGGLPIQATLKPFIDLLLTAKCKLNTSAPLSTFLKGGIAYRQLQLQDRTSSRDGIRKVNAELQAGLAYQVTSHVALSAFYQGIYSGSNAGLQVDSAGNVTLSRIPSQNAGFLGFEYNIF